MSEERRVLVFGIDGTTFDLLKPWAELASPEETYSEEEAEAVANRLRGLGYL